MSIFIYLFSFNIYAGPELACMMLACELEKVTLSGWTLGNKAPPWAVVGSSHSLASKEGLDLGPVWSLALALLCHAHTSQMSAVPNGVLLLCL